MDQNVDPRWSIEPLPGALPGDAVDVWLRRDLKRRYDDALREPLPRDLVDLLALTDR